MNRYFSRTFGVAPALVALLVSGLMTSSAHAQENRIFAGSECSLSEVSNAYQDRHFGKLKNNSGALKTAVCPISRLHPGDEIDFIAVDIAGQGSAAGCLLDVRLTDGHRSALAATDVLLVNPDLSPPLYRHRWFPGTPSLTLGGNKNQGIAFRCKIGGGDSILRYRVLTK